ncbi:MAG: sigma-54 dependent transcriptional regulator [Myxococcota bacterium]|nr:sigma-54 dependent transcriptional regulator [Myxococcota bacterium]
MDGDAEVRQAIGVHLRGAGYEVETAADGEEAAGACRARGFDVVIADAGLPAGGGLDLLGELRRASPGTEVVLTSRSSSVEHAVQAMQLGAADYLCKPFDLGQLEQVVETAIGRARAGASSASASRLDPFDAIVGTSRALRELVDLVRRVAETDSTVLVTGETGTGKELVGRAIHRASGRHAQEFCAVNSAALPESLLESELFGHRKGSFTGATSHKKGLFEHADRGTVFLDEVAEMPLAMQAKLLRFLQTGEIRPVGSERTRCVDIRLVAATNKDLEAEVEAGRFREDLYYRLAVIPIQMPSLRDRSEDIPLLATHFLAIFARKLSKPVKSIEPAALERLCSHSWPGNVRELENCMERAVALCKGETVGPEVLPARVLKRSPQILPGELESLEVVERIHILNTLEKVGWNRKRAAEVLRISTTTLWRRLKDFGIDGPVGSSRGRIDVGVTQ